MNRVFFSLGEFERHLALMVATEPIMQRLARGTVAKRLSIDAKAKIGRPDLLPPPLAESTVTDRLQHGFSANETLLRTGALRDSIGWKHDGPSETSTGSTSPYAPYHELGGKIPGRPPMRSFLLSTLHENDNKYFAMYLAVLAMWMDTLQVRSVEP